MDTKKLSQKGFSIIELVAVMAIIAIMSAVSLYYIAAQRQAYASEEFAMQIADLLREAKQRAFTQKETIRIEINRTDQAVNIIDENLPGNANDDVLIRSTRLVDNDNVVRVNTIPGNVTGVPPSNSPIQTVAYAASQHPLSNGDSVCTVRFLRNGTVADAGVDAIGTGSVTRGFSIYVWKPNPQDTNNAQILNAITIGGGTGNMRMWKYKFGPAAGNTNGNTNGANSSQWVDSRVVY